jgi:alpha-beta hydrolase superfamily lysophospholipase
MRPALLALSLAGCMATGVHYRQDAAVAPPDLSFRMDDGAVLPGRVWRADGAERGVIVALHGFGDSRDAWEHSGPRLAARGFTVYAYDQRGFGAAPGRGHWAGTERMVDDAAEVAADVARRETPGVPLTVLGESMGGAVLMVASAEDAWRRHGAAVAGTVLLAPAVWGRGQMNPLLVAALDVADAVAPERRMTGREIELHVRASDDRAELLKLARDPLTLDGASLATIGGLVELMTRAQAAAGRMRGPVLIAYGAKDDLIPPAATAAAWAKLPGDDRRAYYSDGYHLMLRDLDHAAVDQDIASWAAHPERPLPSGADVAAAGWVAGRPWMDAAPFPLPDAYDNVGGGDPRDDR